METTLSATEDQLVDSLSFRLPSTANYITSRDDVTFYPANGNEFSPTGVKILRFMITGTQWLDPRSVRIQFKLNNRDQVNNMALINHLPHNFFRRLRILAGGTLIEDIDFYNRVVNMIHTLNPFEKQLNDSIEGFGQYSDSGVLGFNELENSPALDAGASKVVLFPLMCGLFTQDKYLPLRFMQGLQIELEVVNQFTDCVLSHVAPVQEPTPMGADDVFAVPPNVPQLSTNWTISEAQIKCSVIELDSQLDNEYTDHLMQGKNIPIPLSTFVHQVQTVGQTDRPTLSMSRAFTRLNKVFITFYKVPYVWIRNAEAMDPNTDPPVRTATLASHKPLRELNYFWNPNHIYDHGTLWGTNNENSPNAPFDLYQGRAYQGVGSEVELQLQVGSKVLPVIPSRSLQEQFYQLRKGIFGDGNSQTQLNITEKQYRTYKWINVFDLQKINGAFSSGMSTRTGDLITIKILNLQHVDILNRRWADTYADLLHATFHHDIVMSITDAGVTILE